MYIVVSGLTKIAAPNTCCELYSDFQQAPRETKSTSAYAFKGSMLCHSSQIPLQRYCPGIRESVTMGLRFVHWLFDL